MSNTEIKRPVLSLNVVGPSDDNNEFIVGTMVDGNDQYPAIQFGGTTFEAQNGELHISGDLVVDGDVYTDGSDEPVGPGGGGTHVAANSGEVTTDTLRTLQVGDVNYSVPERVIIVPNEDGVIPTETLETLQIGETVYGIPSGGGSDILDSNNVFTGGNTFERRIRTPGVGNFAGTEDQISANSGIGFDVNYDTEDPSSSYSSFELESGLNPQPETMDFDEFSKVSSTVNNDTAGVYMESNTRESSAGIEIESWGGEYAADTYVSMGTHVSVPQDEGEPLQCNGMMGLYAQPVMEDDTLVGVKSYAVIEADTIDLQADEVLVNGEPISGGGGGVLKIDSSSIMCYKNSSGNYRGFLFAESGDGNGNYSFSARSLYDLIISIIHGYNEGKDIWLTGEVPEEPLNPSNLNTIPMSFKVIGVMNPVDNTGTGDSYVTVVVTAPVMDSVSTKIESKMIYISDHEDF